MVNMMANSRCVTESYLSIILVINNNIYWRIEGNFSPDYVLGITCIGMALTNYTGYFIVRSINRQLILYELQDLDKLGGYISDRNRSTREALECATRDKISPQSCEFRKITPDDGTTATWVFDHNEINEAKWNLIMTDCARDFLAGFNLICKVFGVNMWNYILNEPLGSEGGVGSWGNITADSHCAIEDFYK